MMLTVILSGTKWREEYFKNSHSITRFFLRQNERRSVYFFWFPNNPKRIFSLISSVISSVESLLLLNQK